MTFFTQLEVFNKTIIYLQNYTKYTLSNRKFRNNHKIIQLNIFLVTKLVYLVIKNEIVKWLKNLKLLAHLVLSCKFKTSGNIDVPIILKE